MRIFIIALVLIGMFIFVQKSFADDPGDFPPQVGACMYGGHDAVHGFKVFYLNGGTFEEIVLTRQGSGGYLLTSKWKPGQILGDYPSLQPALKGLEQYCQ